MQRLHLKDKQLFDACLAQRPCSLAAYAFENIMLWSALYDIFWIPIDDALCVFFKDTMGCFLYLPPVGAAPTERTLRACFSIMNRINNNTAVSRIENIPAEDTDWYRQGGYMVTEGYADYICRRDDMASLEGSVFKKKRASAHSFATRYAFEYRTYHREDAAECLLLFRSWMEERKQKKSNALYRRLLDDNFIAFQTTLKLYGALPFCGRVITVRQRIKAVTLGYPLHNGSFVIAFEVCDLSLHGIAQFIFREFCRELRYCDINIMDDSGLPNLERVKASYQPYRRERSFIARV